MLIDSKTCAQKWCPFTHVVSHSGTPAGNRMNRDDGSAPRGSSCMGESCMAWRWAGWRTSIGTIAPEPAESDRVGERLGYCGLASKPYGTVA